MNEPISYEEWKANNPDLVENAGKCAQCWGRLAFKCGRCAGSGEIEDTEEKTVEVCSDCEGNGRIRCDNCNGDGTDLYTKYRRQLRRDKALLGYGKPPR